jgi:hypothetical protein
MDYMQQFRAKIRKLEGQIAFPDTEAITVNDPRLLETCQLN